MFDLAKFDTEIKRRNLAEQGVCQRRFALAGSNSVEHAKNLIPSRCNGFAETGLILAGSVCAAALVLTLIGPLPQAATSEMTYNGMTLNEFAVVMNMPADDVYLIAMFEELCMTA